MGIVKLSTIIAEKPKLVMASFKVFYNLRPWCRQRGVAIVQGVTFQLDEYLQQETVHYNNHTFAVYPEFAYRYIDSLRANYDPWEEYEQRGSHVVVTCTKYPVVCYTPKGFWIVVWDPQVRASFVNTTATKQFAHLCIADAKEGFKKRKGRQIRIYQARIADAEKAISMIESEAFNAKPSI